MKWIALILVALGALRAATTPNVLLIISDDQAWSDYGFMGHPVIETPRLDRFAEQSLVFTRGYVATPLCRPSLASLFTGLHPHQHGLTGNDLEDGAGKNVSRTSEEGAALHQQLYDRFRECPSLAGLLGGAGYLSLQTGKWWEGDPTESGFTEAMTHGDPARGARHGDKGLAISRQGIAPIRRFLDRAAAEKKPFFIWHAPFLPHTPHNPPQALFDKYLEKVDSRFVARYFAMVEWFDQTCGELFDELDQRDLTDNTLVLYVTDNGWIQSPDHRHYAPLSKQDIHEGGVRTPIMLRWPGHIEPRRDTTHAVSSIDIPVTILEAAGLEPPAAMPGIDLTDASAVGERPAVFGADYSHTIHSVAHRTRHLESTFVIAGPWKLIRHNPAHFPPPAYGNQTNGKKWNQDGQPELYQLLDDPAEEHNLAASKPEVLARLGKLLDAWMKEFPAR